jgi:hypothetical protein
MAVPIPGLVKLRKHQFARQTDFGTAVAAVRAYPFSGTPTINLNWVDPEADLGSIDLIAAPTREAEDLTASLSAPKLYYNDLPLMLSAMLGDDVDAVGSGSLQWLHSVGSTQDALDLFTYEFGDDLDGTGGKPNDWFQLFDGLTDSLTFTAPEGLGALSADMAWRFGAVRYEGATEAALQPSPAVPTSALTVDNAGIPVYLGDATIAIDSLHGDIGETIVADALHSFTLGITQDIDLKRLANGTGFDMSGYSRSGLRIIELRAQWAKTADIVGVGSESDAWFSTTAVNRFVNIHFESTAIAEAGSPDIPYSWDIKMPLRYYTREDGAVGGNSTVTLIGRAFYHSTLGYTIRSEVINTLATASL